MPRVLRPGVAWTRTHEGRKSLRCTSISVLYGFHIVKGVIWATVLGNLVATLPSYYLNRSWTWGKRGRSHFRKEIVPFWLMSFAGIGVSMIGAAWARHEVKSLHWAHLTSTALVSFTNLFSFGLFWVLKIMVFNRIFHDHTLDEMDAHLTAEELGAA